MVKVNVYLVLLIWIKVWLGIVKLLNENIKIKDFIDLKIVNGNL